VASTQLVGNRDSILTPEEYETARRTGRNWEEIEADWALLNVPIGFPGAPEPPQLQDLGASAGTESFAARAASWDCRKKGAFRLNWFLLHPAQTSIHPVALEC
jgi:hypothetical protein